MRSFSAMTVVVGTLLERSSRERSHFRISFAGARYALGLRLTTSCSGCTFPCDGIMACFGAAGKRLVSGLGSVYSWYDILRTGTNIIRAESALYLPHAGYCREMGLQTVPVDMR